MAGTQDASINIAVESVFKTYQAPVRALEFFDESLDWDKNIKQGQGLRVGARVPRSGRRVVPTAEGGGDISVEMLSKSLGLLLQACLGTGTSTVVSGATYQQVFTLGDVLPSLTIQKGVVEASGTVDPLTFLGCMVDSWELAFPNADIATLKATFDAADVSTAQSYVAPNMLGAGAGNLFHFANATLALGGTLVAPTATTLASVTSPSVANVRGGSISMNNNLRDDRFNMGASGRKDKQLTGARPISGKLDVEYTSTLFRDAVLNETPMDLLLTYTGGALSTGVETLQVVVPEIKFDSELPKTNGPDLIVPSMAFQGLDNLVAAQPIWIVLRTSDIAL